MGAPKPLDILRKQQDWMPTHAQPWEWQDMPNSAKEAKRLGVQTYFTGSFCSNGHRCYRLVSTYGCAMCASEKRINASDRSKEKQRKAAREWRTRNLERERKRERSWHHNNLERSRSRARRYNRENPKSVCARVLARAKRVKQATPPWADLGAIREFYRNRPEGYHVDHIVPINGKNVCGLHVIGNLQYLPASENLSKGNRFDG